MQVAYQDISILPDNDRAYFSLLQGVVEAIDGTSSMTITSTPSGYRFRIVPSGSLHINTILLGVTELSTLMGIQLELSKSIKSSSSISFFVQTINHVRRN